MKKNQIDFKKLFIKKQGNFDLKINLANNNKKIAPKIKIETNCFLYELTNFLTNKA